MRPLPIIEAPFRPFLLGICICRAPRFENKLSVGGLGHELCKCCPVEVDEDALPSKDDIKNEIAPEGHQEGRHKGAVAEHLAYGFPFAVTVAGLGIVALGFG